MKAYVIQHRTKHKQITVQYIRNVRSGYNVFNQL